MTRKVISLFKPRRPGEVTINGGLLVALHFLFAHAAWAGTLSGEVIAVADGDTLTLLDGMKRQHKIRLKGIDAPEKRQAWGRRSMQTLAALTFRKEATAECGKVDRYRRAICKIRVDGRDVNLAQIEAGMAWWYRAYEAEQSMEDRLAYGSAEVSARTARRGLWVDSDQVPPWSWRRLQRSSR